MLSLDQKIMKAATCVYFNARLSSSGNCHLNAYAPFDCEHCTSYEREDLTKICKICGGKMVWENPHIPGHFQESSCNIDDWPICHDCMVEHCCSTDCLGCEYGEYPDCQFLELKEHYMSED